MLVKLTAGCKKAQQQKQVIVCENKENGFENQLEKSSSWTLLLWQEKSSLK
jgi:hypothetical protein